MKQLTVQNANQGLWLWLLIICCTAFTATAQTTVIEGKVVQAASGKPLVGASVFIQSTSTFATTNKEGRFSLPPLPYGSYPITVFYEGLKTSLLQVEARHPKVELVFKLEVLEETLREVEVLRKAEQQQRLQRLNAVEGTAIYEAKKSEVINIEGITANLATNNSRQVYNKVPGLNIWESDGAGLQLGIGGRGLSPDRTSNFNTRQNGYDISADALGYPESYYTPPLEGVEKIQIVRGAASLQYGTQFGGMLNFVMKKGPADKPFEFTTRQTLGSFGLYNSFNSIGGTKGKINYYGFHQYKRGDGWRPNSGFEAQSAFADLNMQLSEKFFLCLEYTHMNYLAQQPGGLTDTNFAADPRLSRRDRNWFKVNWNLMAVLMEYKFSPRTKLEMKNFGLVASRDALGDLDRIDRDPEQAERKLISDKFRNLGSELRLMHHYHTGRQPAVFLAGTRLYQGKTAKQQGAANNGKGADFHFLKADSLAVNHLFPNRNAAFFVENIFNVSNRLSLVPGIRYELISTRAEGSFQEVRYQQNSEGYLVPVTITIPDSLKNNRDVLLAGLGISYKLKHEQELYANLSQNYRSVNFTDLRNVNQNERVSANLKDESGFNADLGIRASTTKFTYDLSAFYLNYGNRIGFLLETEGNVPVRVRQNLTDAHIVGIETIVQTDIMQWLQASPSYSLEAYVNMALIRGRYVRSSISAISGNQVELVPDVNLKSGLEFKKKQFSLAYQFTYLGKQYTDAQNTLEINSAVVGLIPAFYVMDLSASYNWKWFGLEGGVNNLTNNMYFTRRATAYPGPGIIPSDGRNFYLTLQFKY